MNPFDEIAVEEAVRMRERNKEAVKRIVCALVFCSNPTDGLLCRSSQVAGRAAYGAGPVSYTHLTLPTNREV